MMGLVLYNQNIPERPLSFPKVHQVSLEVFMNTLAIILQGSKEFLSQDKRLLPVDRVEYSKGSGRRYFHGLSFDALCAKKMGIICTPNMNDNKCLAYAIMRIRIKGFGAPELLHFIERSTK